ncbi:MAG: phosphate signaling complex protein PhoU [bacterium]|nr:phosphate signaling complex protein PhoU [bacterium]
MTKHFYNELERLKKKILDLTARVEDSLRMAVKSVTELDRELAMKVISTDQEIDALEVEVEEECLKILALHQPVAADLRYIVAVLKINSDLERIGDLAVNIAKRTKNLQYNNGVRIPFDLHSMLAKTEKMVSESADALIRSDAELAQAVRVSDEEIDKLHKLAFQTVYEQVKKHPDHAQYFISLLSVSRALERIADHATNIAEDVVYMVDGEIVRHQLDDEDF